MIKKKFTALLATASIAIPFYSASGSGLAQGASLDTRANNSSLEASSPEASQKDYEAKSVSDFNKSLKASGITPKNIQSISYVNPDGTEIKFHPSSSQRVVAAYSIEWGPCWPWEDTNKVIGTYKTGHPPMISAFLGNSILKCGNSSFGYRHIEQGKKVSWQNITPEKGNSDWEETASFALKTTLANPLKYCYQKDRNTNVYVGLIKIVSSKTTKTYYPRAVVGRSTKNVVTVFPQNAPVC